MRLTFTTVHVPALEATNSLEHAISAIDAERPGRAVAILPFKP